MTLSWCSVSVWLRSEFQRKINGGSFYWSSIPYVRETFCLDSANFPRPLRCRPWLVKSFLSVFISKIDACWYALTLFISFLLNDLISLFTHEDFIMSYLSGALTRIILVWLFVLMKFLMCLRAVYELFFEMLLKPLQRIITSFFVCVLSLQSHCLLSSLVYLVLHPFSPVLEHCSCPVFQIWH